jgi:orotidine-5'-phosphate decarboxylase
VSEILENPQALLNDRMALAVLDVSDEANAAGVVFVGWVIESLPARYVHFGIPGMRPSKKAGGRQRSMALPGFAIHLGERINIPQNVAQTQYP